MYGCYIRVFCGMYAIFCMFDICYVYTLSYTMCLSYTYTRIGIRPDILIDLMKQKFLSLNGTVHEQSILNKIDVYNNQAVVTIKSTTITTPPTSTTTSSPLPTISTTTPNTTATSTAADVQLSARLVIDSMGNGSPISKQARGAIEPDGICIVVGSCASGFNATNNTYSDIIYTDTPISTVTLQPGLTKQAQTQYFWESFPAGSGPTDRTTYLFSYMDAKPERPSVSDVSFDPYFTYDFTNVYYYTNVYYCVYYS